MTVLPLSPQRRPLSRPAAGFTLTELLVVILILGVLTAIAIPVARSVQGKAHRAACLGNLRQLGTALETYLQDHGDILPDWQPGRRSHQEEVPVIERELLPGSTAAGPGQDNPLFHCPADKKEYARCGCSYLWNTTQNGRHRSQLLFFGEAGEPQRIPLITDKEAWHPGKPGVNFLYADLSASTKVQFGVSP